MKFLLFSLTLLSALVVSPAQAATIVQANAAQYEVDKGSVGAFSKWKLGTVIFKNREHSMKCVYDFAKQGGAIGAINLKNSALDSTCVVPKGAIIRDVIVDVVTAVTSGGAATVALTTGQTAADLLGATAKTSFTLNALLAGVPVGTAATAFKLTADRTLSATVATAALTAGKLNVHVKYQISE